MAISTEDLANAMRAATPEHSADLNHIFDDLEAELGHDEAVRIWDLAGAEVDHDAAIEEATTSLTRLLNAVLEDLGKARDELGRLSMGEAYHPDYAECTAGEDLDRFLADAARLIRAAQCIHHGIAEPTS